MAQLKSTQINDTGFLQLPAGTSAQRPASPANGQMRYNTTLGRVEWYDATYTAWLPAGFVPPIATGGTVTDITQDGVNYRVHLFTSVGTSTFTVTRSGSVEYLIVAGGGSSGSTAVNGGNSSFASITTIGGGAGRTGSTAGNSGGSGGGAGGSDGFRLGGAGTPGQGNNGGSGEGGGGISTNRGGGGGGAGSVGTGGHLDPGGTNNQGIGVGGASGDGIILNITGNLIAYSGGGVGTGHPAFGGRPGTPGIGGQAKGQAGTANTGGGAGGSGAQQGGGGGGGLLTGFITVTPQSYNITVGAGGAGSIPGGSGVVIIRYRLPPV